MRLVSHCGLRIFDCLMKDLFKNYDLFLECFSEVSEIRLTLMLLVVLPAFEMTTK